MADTREEELATARRERVAAMVAGDLPTLARVTADDFTMVHALNAVTDTKATLIERIRSGALAYRSMDTEDEDVRVYGDTAVAMAQLRIVIDSLGREFTVRTRLLDVWVHSDAGWQLVASQATALPREG